MTQNPQIKKTGHKVKLQCDPDSINRSPINKSSSKMQYSIPKAKRFAHMNTQPICSSIYEIPDTKTKRATTLGLGKKLDLSKQSFVKPAPGDYTMKSDFDIRKGITIAAGREVVRNNSVFQIQKQIPGPGHYECEKMQKKSHIYTMGKRYTDMTNKQQKKVPGPGAYDVLQLKGNLSNIKNMPSLKFGNEQRSPQYGPIVKQKVPGPGAYGQKNIQSTSKFSHKGGFSFGSGQRKEPKKSSNQAPGPGYYNAFSEFLH